MYLDISICLSVYLYLSMYEYGLRIVRNDSVAFEAHSSFMWRRRKKKKEEKVYPRNWVYVLMYTYIYIHEYICW